MKNTRFYVATLVALFGLATSSVHAILPSKEEAVQNIKDSRRAIKDLRNSSNKDSIVLVEEGPWSNLALIAANNISFLKSKLNALKYGEDNIKELNDHRNNIRFNLKLIKWHTINEVTSDKEMKEKLRESITKREEIIAAMQTLPAIDGNGILGGEFGTGKMILDITPGQEYNEEEIKNMIQQVKDEAVYFYSGREVNGPHISSMLKYFFPNSAWDREPEENERANLKNVFDPITFKNARQYLNVGLPQETDENRRLRSIFKKYLIAEDLKKASKEMEEEEEAV